MDTVVGTTGQADELLEELDSGASDSQRLPKLIYLVPAARGAAQGTLLAGVVSRRRLRTPSFTGSWFTARCRVRPPV